MAARVEKKERTSISDAQLKDELVKLFEAGNTDKGNCWELLGTKFKMRKQRYLQAFDAALKEWQGLREKARAEQVHTNTKTLLKNAVKTKEDRLLILQNQIENCIKELKKGTTTAYSMFGDEYQRELSISEKVALRKNIRDLQAEISKMEGDYAPEKREDTSLIKVASIDPKKLSTKTIKEIIAARNGSRN